MEQQHDADNAALIGFARRPEVKRLTGLSSTTIVRRIANGTFPRGTPIGDRAVGWPRDVLADWLKNPTGWRAPAAAQPAAEDAPAQDAP